VDCDKAATLLAAYLDGELSGPQKFELDAHLHACDECRAASESLRLQDVSLRKAFAPHRRAASRVADRVVARLHAEHGPARGTSPWLKLSAAAAAGFLLAVLVFRPWVRHAPDVTGEPGQANSTETTEIPPTKPQVFSLSVASKAIEVLAPGATIWEGVQAGGQVALGSQVRTGRDAFCEFQSPDGTAIRVHSQTDLVFEQLRFVRVQHGRILARVAESAAAFLVGVPGATITSLGTEFDVQCRDVETDLMVLEGATKIDAFGRREYVLRGEKARITRGSAIQKEPIGNLVQATSWVHEILKLKGPNDQELAQRVNDILAQIGQSKMEYLQADLIRQLGSHCVPPLSRYVCSERSQEHPGQRREAASFVAELAKPWSIPDILPLLEDRDGVVRSHAASALARLTGQDFGFKAEDWRNKSFGYLAPAVQKWKSWWRENKDRYPSPP
jgi:predicted anti-sigma-YlaC factor YlaD